MTITTSPITEQPARAPRKTISLESLPAQYVGDHTGPGRGARLGKAIHADHGEKWEILTRMRAMGLERTSPITQRKMGERLEMRRIATNPLQHPCESDETDTTVTGFPRPTSPARSDENGRPAAVDHSIKKMRSFNNDSSSMSSHARTTWAQRPSHIPIASNLRVTPPRSSPVNISIFPQIPEHQRHPPAAAKVEVASAAATGKKLTLKTSSVSLGGKPVRAGKLQKKARTGGELRTPVIHVTKPSQERMEGAQGQVLSGYVVAA